MKISCDVIRDLLPLYAEDMVSADSRNMVAEHLRGCPSCAAELEELKQPVAAVPKEPVAGLKQFRKRVVQWLILGVMAAIFFGITLVAWGWGFALQVRPIPAEEAIVSVSEEDGVVKVMLSPTASNGLTWRTRIDEVNGIRQHYLSCGKQTFDWLLRQEVSGKMTELPLRGATAVWYYENGEMICLYGSEEPLMTDWGKDPVLVPALIMGTVLALADWLLWQKWLRYLSVFIFTFALADWMITGGLWIGFHNSEGILVAIFCIMALLLTCCIAFVWELISGSMPVNE